MAKLFKFLFKPIELTIIIEPNLLLDKVKQALFFEKGLSIYRNLEVKFEVKFVPVSVSHGVSLSLSLGLQAQSRLSLERTKTVENFMRDFFCRETKIKV